MIFPRSLVVLHSAQRKDLLEYGKVCSPDFFRNKLVVVRVVSTDYAESKFWAT
jgi:hypothetical protein